MPPKKPDSKLPTSDEITEDGLRKMLKLKKTEKFMIGELAKVKKTKTGGMFDFRGKEYKMTPLMQKRVDLALTFLRLPKAKPGEFAKKNKGKAKPKNPIGGDLLEEAISKYAQERRDRGLPTLGSIGTSVFPTRAAAQRNIDQTFAGNGIIFEQPVGADNRIRYETVSVMPNNNRTNILGREDREGILEAARIIDQDANNN